MPKNQQKVLIEEFGFSTKNIKLVTDAAENKGTSLYPTSKNIKAAISWLVSVCTAGDLIFFAYSGHGAHVPDEEGIEEDGQDEILCPVDLGRYLHEWQANGIRDDFLFEKFHDELPAGVKCVCSYDCCHSGTISDLPTQRGLTPAPAPTARSGEMVGRSMAEPEVVQAAIYRMQLKAQQRGARPRGDLQSILAPGARSPPSKDIWAFSGCRDDQTSADATLDGQRQGAMTWALLSSLKENQYKFQYDPLLERMRNKLQGRFTQVPQCSTTRDELFEHVYMAKGESGQTGGGNAIVLPASPPASLAPGQSVQVCDLTDNEPDIFTLGLAWEITAGKKIDLDAGLIMLDARLQPLDLVYFKQLSSKVAGCAKHSGDNRSGAGSGDDETITVDLNTISKKMPSCQYLGFVINSYSGEELNDVKAAHAHLFDTDRPKIDLCEVDISSETKLDCTALLMCCLFRSGSKWYMRSIVEGAGGKTVRDNVDELQAYCKRHLTTVKQTAAKEVKLHATVPPGARPGDNVKMMVPAGYCVNVTVPPGARPGATIEFVSPPGFAA